MTAGGVPPLGGRKVGAGERPPERGGSGRSRRVPEWQCSHRRGVPVSGAEGVPGWTQVRCVTCSGHGVVSVYSAHDFEGPGECAHCGGSGAEWVSPRGRTALYPGGPFTGSLPRGKEAVS